MNIIQVALKRNPSIGISGNSELGFYHIVVAAGYDQGQENFYSPSRYRPCVHNNRNRIAYFHYFMSMNRLLDCEKTKRYGPADAANQVL